MLKYIYYLELHPEVFVIGEIVSSFKYILKLSRKMDGMIDQIKFAKYW